MQNTTSIGKLTQAILNGGTVTREGIIKRILVEGPTFGNWYVITMIDGPRHTRTFTARREDCQTAHTLTGPDFARWAARLEHGVSA